LKSAALVGTSAWEADALKNVIVDQLLDFVKRELVSFPSFGYENVSLLSVNFDFDIPQ